MDCRGDRASSPPAVGHAVSGHPIIEFSVVENGPDDDDDNVPLEEEEEEEEGETDSPSNMPVGPPPPRKPGGITAA